MVSPIGPLYPYSLKTDMSIQSIHQWHSLARPTPDQRAFDVQLGCHFEEVAEMLEALQFQNAESPDISLNGEDMHAYHAIHFIADRLKSGLMTARITDRNAFADSVGDQVVTAVGAAHCAHMKPVQIVERVNQSNWSKYHEGVPRFFPNGKIAKAPGYKEPDLEGTY